MKQQKYSITADALKHSKSTDTSLWKIHLAILTIACFLLLQTGIAHAKNITEHFYTFLAKAENPKKIGPAPELMAGGKSMKGLKKLPKGTYFLLIVRISQDHKTIEQSKEIDWDSTIIKLVVIDEKGTNEKGVSVNKGVMVENVLSLTENSTFNKKSAVEKFSLLAHGMPNEWYKLPALLRKLVANDLDPNIFIGPSTSGKGKHQIHTLHKLTMSELTRETLIDLWRLWQPRLDSYDAEKSMTKNLSILEKDIGDAISHEKGFQSSLNTLPSLDQRYFLKFFLEFVSELKKEYVKYIDKDKQRAMEEIRLYNKSRKEAETKYKDANTEYQKARRKDNTLPSLESIVRDLNAAKKLLYEKNDLNGVAYNVRKAKSAYENDYFVESHEFISKAKTATGTAISKISLARGKTDAILTEKPSMIEQLLLGFGLVIGLIALFAISYIALQYLPKFFDLGKAKRIKQKKKEEKLLLLRKKEEENIARERIINIDKNNNLQQINKVKDEAYKNVNTQDPSVAHVRNSTHQSSSYPPSSNENSNLQAEYDQLKNKYAELKEKHRNLKEMRLNNKDKQELARDPLFIKTLLSTNYLERKINTLITKRINATNPRNGDEKNRKQRQKEGSQSVRVGTTVEKHQDGINTVTAVNDQRKNSDKNKILIFDALKRSTIVRRSNMENEFEKVIGNDFSFAKSIQSWMKSNMPPALYREIDSALKTYKDGIIRLYIPEVGEIFNSEDHDLQTTREKEMRGTGGKISKIIRPGIRITENNTVSTVSRAQVEIKT